MRIIVCALHKDVEICCLRTRSHLEWPHWVFGTDVIDIKTHGRVSAAKKAMWHTSVLFTGTAKSPFSTPHISITT